MKNPPIVALLCPALHDMVDNSMAFKDEVVVHEGRRFYRLWKPGEEHQPDKWALIWREIPNGTDDSGRSNRPIPLRVRPDLVHREEPVVELLPESQGGRAVPDSAGHALEVRDGHEGEVELTFEAWATEVRIWAKTYRSMGWIFGDLCLRGLDLWGDEAHQAIDRELGVDEGTIANWLTTCRIWPPESRRHEASFTMHALLNATRRKDPEEADRILDEAIAEGRTSSEVRALLSPSERVRRYTIAELLAALDSRCEPCPGCEPIRMFLGEMA